MISKADRNQKSICLFYYPKKGENRYAADRTSPPKKETAPDMTEAEIIQDLTETEVQSNEPA